MTCTNPNDLLSASDLQSSQGAAVGPWGRRLAMPLILSLFGLVLALHLFGIGRPPSGELSVGGLVGAHLEMAHGPWWELWRILALVVGLVLLAVVLVFRLAAPESRGLGRWARRLTAASALVVGVTVLSVEVPDAFRLGFSYLTFELPLRVLLLGLAASALWIALEPDAARAGRWARVTVLGTLVGILGILVIPQPSESHTPYHLASLCEGRSRAVHDFYPECRGSMEVKARALAVPLGLLPEAHVLHHRTLLRLDRYNVHLDRADWDPRRPFPDPLVQAEIDNGSIHLLSVGFRWACLALVLLLGAAHTIRSSWRPGKRGPAHGPERGQERGQERGLLVALGASALLAASPLLPEITSAALWQLLPTYLLGPLAVLALLGQASEPLPRGALAPSTGVVVTSHGVVETPAGPWKVSSEAAK